jgi:hypothetical protein
MKDAELLAIVSDFVKRRPGASGLALLTAFATIVPSFEAHGILTPDQVIPIVAILTTDSEVPRDLLAFAASALSRPAAPSRDNEIDALYAELHALEASSADPAIEARFQDRLARLRELQGAEAREMAAFAERRRALPRGAADALFNDVHALLERYEHPPGSDRSSDEHG